MASCKAISKHQVQVQDSTGTITYTWTADSPAVIESGQGTDTVEVSTTGDTDITFDLTCEVQDDVGADTFTISVTHSREMASPTADVIYLMNDFGDGTQIIDANGTHNAVLSGTYATDELNQTLELTADGTAISDYELPDDSEWTIVKTYNVGNNVFDMFALNYKGNDKADVWFADQDNDFTLESQWTNVDYTPPQYFRFDEDLGLPQPNPEDIFDYVDDYVNWGTDGSGNWNTDGSSYTIELITPASVSPEIRPIIAFETTGMLDTETYKVSFMATDLVDTPIIFKVSTGGSTIEVNHTITSGYNEFEFTANNSDTRLKIYHDGILTWKYSCTDIVVERL